MSIDDWWWRCCTFCSEGGAHGVGLALGHPGTLGPRRSRRFTSSATVNTMVLGSSVQLLGCTHTQIGAPSQPWQWRSIFFRMIYLSYYSSLCMTPVSLRNLCLQVMEGHTLAGCSFAFNSAGITLIRNWKHKCVACLYGYKNLKKKRSNVGCGVPFWNIQILLSTIAASLKVNC